MQVVPAPVGVLSVRNRTPYSFIPDPQALLRSRDAVYEGLGDVVRRTLVFTHLRHH